MLQADKLEDLTEKPNNTYDAANPGYFRGSIETLCCISIHFKLHVYTLESRTNQVALCILNIDVTIQTTVVLLCERLWFICVDIQLRWVSQIPPLPLPPSIPHYIWHTKAIM